MHAPRSPLMLALASLYLLAGVALAVTFGVRMASGSATDVSAVGAPTWVFAPVAAFDFVLAACILRRVPSTLRVLRGLHTALAVIAATLLFLPRDAADDAVTWIDVAKVVVHAGMATFWWRSRTAVVWFALPRSEKGSRS